jgi:glycosyltransferase involved in cell wall biosynthesis
MGSLDNSVSGSTASMRPFGVVHVVVDLQGGGMESRVASMARRLAGSRVRVSVITLSGREGRVGEKLAPFVHRFHSVRPIRGASMVLPLSLARLIHSTGAEVVHLHSGCWYKGAVAARLAGVRKVVYTEHGREHNETALRKLLDRAGGRWTDAVVAVSDRLRDYMHAVLGIPWKRLYTVQNGVDTEQFTPAPAPAALREALGIPPGAAVIGSVGRLEPVKAYERIIEAVAALRRDSVPARPIYAVICGDGSERDGLISRAEELGVGPLVRLPGWADQPADYYRLFDVFALPSRMEGASVSLMEAMACGAPVVVTDVGASAEIAGKDLAALVVPPGDVAAFVRAVRAVLEDQELASRARRAARARIVECYSLEHMVRKYMSLYAS